MTPRHLAVPIVVALAACLVAGCSDDGASDASGSTSTEANGPSTTLPKETIPQPGGKSVPGSACVTGDAQTFADLALGVLDGTDGARRSQQQAEALKAKLPADLADDLDTLAATYQKVANAGTAATPDLLDDPAYMRANAAVAAYFNSSCGSSPSTTTAG